MAKNILIFVAHPDDDICGMGGTLLKYIDEGKNVIEIIFTKGEKSHPHFKEEVIVEIRKKEMAKVAQQAGIKELIYFDLKELHLKEEVQKYNIKSKIKEILHKYRPEKIFTLSGSETHPDHRVVNQTVLEAVDSLKQKSPVYAFNIWTFPSFKPNPIIYVNISDYFWKKLKLMKLYKSQWLAMYYQQIIPVIVRAKFYGYKNYCKYAEKFAKLR